MPVLVVSRRGASPHGCACERARRADPTFEAIEGALSLVKREGTSLNMPISLSEWRHRAGSNLLDLARSLRKSSTVAESPETARNVDFRLAHRSCSRRTLSTPPGSTTHTLDDQTLKGWISLSLSVPWPVESKADICRTPRPHPRKQRPTCPTSVCTAHSVRHRRPPVRHARMLDRRVRRPTRFRP